MLTIRKAASTDLAAITDLYNQAVLNTVATFDTIPKTIEEQKAWFGRHGHKYPVLVAEEGGAVVGWASLSPWSDRQSYADTAEISAYVGEKCRRRGIGRQLTEAVLQAGRFVGLHTVIARTVEGNNGSMKLAKSLGFQDIGVMKEVGRKFGRLLDVYLMQIIFE